MLLIRRILFFFIISAIIWNSGAYYIFFKTQQVCIRRSINREARNIDEQDIVYVEFSDQDSSGISWIKLNKEFVYRGELYDVVRVERSSKSNIYFCIRDTKEKKLIEDYAKNPEKDNGLSNIARILQKLVTPLSVIQIRQESKIYLSGYLIFYNPCYELSKGFSTVLTPPPDFSFHISGS
jgi:hypothetical protein